MPRGLLCGAAAAALFAGVLAAQQARASESGASFYLLGSGGPEAGVLPPVPGVFFANTVFYYHGHSSGERQLIFNGRVVAGVDGTLAADFPGVVWSPSAKVLNGTFMVGGLVPFGQAWAKASAEFTGPRGRQFSFATGDKAFVIGDPVLTASLGWSRGDTHAAVTDLLNIPIGQYDAGRLSNLAFHRWANDISFAVSWHDVQSGWDLSGKTGFTVNGTNHETDYRTGTEWHLEASVEKQLTPAWALGFQAYHFEQLTADSGAGAVLGPFKGRVTGVGGHAAYNFKIGRAPVTLRLHGTTEFDVQNRLQGHSIWLDLSMPLAVHMPPGAGA